MTLLLLRIILVAIIMVSGMKLAETAMSSPTASDTIASRLVGAWDYVTTYNEFPDGSRLYAFGEEPVGRFIILPNGIYSHIIMRKDLPDIKSGRIRETTPQEAEALAEGVLAHWGKYTVDEKAQSFTGFVEWASFPNIKDENQLRTITKLTRDELNYTNHLSVAGADAKVIAVLKRSW